MEKHYEKNYDWSGYTVRTSKKGWIIEGWSRISGGRSGWKHLLYYDDAPPYNASTDLGDHHNNVMSVGDYIYIIGQHPLGPARVLRRGDTVR